MALDNATLVWIFAFVLIYFLMYHKKKDKLLGSAFLFMNGLLGVLIEDSWIGYLIFGATAVNLIKEMFGDVIKRFFK